MSSPRFSTILVARANGERPTELEVHLREHCQKVRVVPNLSGAHVIFPKEQGLALRVYHPDKQQLWERRNPPPVVPTATATTALDSDRSTAENATVDIDGIRGFCQRSQWSLVFFVVTDTSVVNDSASMVHRAKRLLDVPLEREQRPLRIFVVHDTSQVIQSVMDMTKGIAPKRGALLRNYHVQARANAGVTNGSDDETTRATLAIHAHHVVTKWANHQTLPLGEAEMLMKALGNVSNFAGAPNAPHHPLDTFPLDDRTKQDLSGLFLGPVKDDDEENVESVHFQREEKTNAYEEITFSLPLTITEHSTQPFRTMGYAATLESFEEPGHDFDVREPLMIPVYVDSYLDPSVQHQRQPFQQQQQVIQQFHPPHPPQYRVAQSVGYHHPATSTVYQPPMRAAPSFGQRSVVMPSHAVTHSTQQPSMRAAPSFRQDSVPIANGPAQYLYPNKVQTAPRYVLSYGAPQFQQVAPAPYLATPQYPQGPPVTPSPYIGTPQYSQGQSFVPATAPRPQGQPPFASSTARMTGFQATPRPGQFAPSAMHMAPGFQTPQQQASFPRTDRGFVQPYGKFR